MTERLEKELVTWHKNHFKKEGTFNMRSGTYLLNNSQLDLSGHFYKLALEDIRKEIVKLSNSPDNLGAFDDVSNDAAYSAGFYNTCQKILEIIDTQTQNN